MSKDDIETATMNVMFDGSEEEDDDKDDYKLIDRSDRCDKDVSRCTLGYNRSLWLNARYRDV